MGLESVRASGKWTCADVPLPSIPKTHVILTTMYSPCLKMQCESGFGSYVPGAERASRDFASAVAAGARASGVVPGMYLKTQRTEMLSDRYEVSTETMLLHPGQQFVRVFDSHTQLSQEFQVSANETKSHCVSRLERKKAEKTKAAPDLHFEYVGMEEEAGIMLRHFRATKSSEFLIEMMGDTSTNVKRAVTEFWDDAQTLQPHRTVNSEGTVLMVTSMRASLSDAAVEEQFGAWLDDCTERTKTKMGIPTMTKWTDLNAEDIEYYKYEQFGQSDELMKEAAAENDAFAIYLLKAADPLSVSDTCKRKCQTEIDAVRTQLQEQQILTCSEGGILETAMMCMGEVHECVESKFYVDNQYDCWSTHNNTEERQLETEEETTEEPEGSLLLLSNHTEVMPVASRQTFEINGLCQSIFMFPLPVLEWQRVNYQFKKGEKDDHGNIIPTDAEGNHVTWTLPWCAQLAFGDVEEEETKKNEVTGEVTKVTREVTKVQNMHRDRWEKTKDAFDMWGDMSDMFADPEEIAASKKQINKV